MWIEKLTLTDFRNHARLNLALDARAVVVTGPNGAGKTNLMEAVSLLSAGQGLRRAPFAEIARQGGAGGWAVAARLQTAEGAVDIGTGLAAGQVGSDKGGRIVRINGANASSSGALAEHVEMLWLTPAQDGLFTGPAGDRRRFLDRLVATFDPGFRTLAAAFERAMRQRNRLLEDDVRDGARYAGLERMMAEAGVAMAAARRALVSALEMTISATREASPSSPFPWAAIALEGRLETEIARRPAVDVEDEYAGLLAAGRPRDRAAGRTLEGPHRSDLVVAHGPKAMPAHMSSTGEQKALLVGLVLAQARLLADRNEGAAPILLLDEIAAHLDEWRRAALAEELVRLGSQAWMTGTEKAPFSAFGNAVRHVEIAEAG